MSQGSKKYPYREAIVVANELVELLTPYCEWIIIAGSLRRLKPGVGDVEILYIPKIKVVPADMFSTTNVDLAAKHLDVLIEKNILQKWKNRKGFICWGTKNKFAIHVATGIPVNLFATTASNMWVALAIRTGSKNMVLDLTTGANRLNRTLHAYGEGITDRATGETIRANSEQHVFELCGVTCREPELR